MLQAEAAQRAAAVGALDANPKLLFSQMNTSVAEQLVHEEKAEGFCC
jgi:hypothetical protein